MEPELRWIAEATRATGIRRGERIQSLWSGYGELFRVHLEGADVPSVIVKWVSPPARPRPKRMRSGVVDLQEVGHARKCRSYDVETAWYRTYAPRCAGACRVAAMIDSRAGNEQWILILEDLDVAGFPERRHDLGQAEIDLCLAWLAGLHARFLGVAPANLWKTGTYWHLATRREELPAIADGTIREAAPLLDQKLRAAAFQTVVHGDAKPANFCFARGARAVAAVDFQYTGGGCGMKDVAYLLSGSMSHGSPAEAQYLDAYFRHLRAALAQRAEPVDLDALEAEWRALYPIACADYYRFIAGWAPAHFARDLDGQRLVRDVVRVLT